MIEDTNYKIIHNHKFGQDTVILNHWALIGDFFINMRNSYDMDCLANLLDMPASELLAELTGSDTNFTLAYKEDEGRIELFRWFFSYKAVFIKDAVENILSSNDPLLAMTWFNLLTKKMRSGANLARTGSQLNGYCFDFYDKPEDYDELAKTIIGFILKNSPSTSSFAKFLKFIGIEEPDEDLIKDLMSIYNPRGLVHFTAHYGFPESLVQAVLGLKEPKSSILLLNEMQGLFGQQLDPSPYYEQVRQTIKEKGDPDYAIDYLIGQPYDEQRLELLPLAESKATLSEGELINIFSLKCRMDTKKLAMPLYDMVLKTAQDNPKVAMDWIENIDLAEKDSSASDIDPAMKEIVLNCNDPEVAYRYCHLVKAEPKMQNVIVASGNANIALRYAQDINPNKKMLGVIIDSGDVNIARQHYHTIDKYKDELEGIISEDRTA